MKASGIGLFLYASLMAGCLSRAWGLAGPSTAFEIDEARFDRAVAEAIRAIPSEARRISLGATMRNAWMSWRERPGYADARTRAREACPEVECDFVRFEFGSPNGGSYQVFWYILLPHGGGVSISQARDMGPLKSASLSPARWSAVTSAAKAFAEDGCRSEFLIADGTVLLLTMRLGEIDGASVAYGLYPADPVPQPPECADLLKTLVAD